MLLAIAHAAAANQSSTIAYHVASGRWSVGNGEALGMTQPTRPRAKPDMLWNPQPVHGSRAASGRLLRIIGLFNLGVAFWMIRASKSYIPIDHQKEHTVAYH